MNRTLRRPMFRIGGTAEGITSGLQPRQGYEGTGNAADQRVSPPRNRNFNDFLISMGLDLVSRPKAGNIFQQVATSARGPFKEFQATRTAQEERDWKMGLHREQMDWKEKFIESTDANISQAQSSSIAASNMDTSFYKGQVDAAKNAYGVSDIDSFINKNRV